MKSVLSGLILILAATVALRAEETVSPLRFEQAFRADGKVEIHLSPGGYEVVAGPGHKIIVTLEGGRPERLRKVKVRIRATGNSDARIEVSDTPHNNFFCRIQIPCRTDLRIRLSAGDLKIEGIEGSKDIWMGAGNLEIDVGDPADYSRVEASVWTGELSASPFHASKGGLFRSFTRDGAGPYRLRARVRAGAVTLYSRATRQTL